MVPLETAMRGAANCEDDDGKSPPDSARGVRRPYEAPRIVWTEDYEPMSFGISCAKQPGNPPCNTGPLSG